MYIIVGVAGKSDKNDVTTKSNEERVIYPNNLTQMGKIRSLTKKSILCAWQQAPFAGKCILP